MEGMFGSQKIKTRPLELNNSDIENHPDDDEDSPVRQRTVGFEIQNYTENYSLP